MAPLTAEEYGEATLEVEVSLDSSEVQWMRQGVLIHPGAKYTLNQQGPKHSLTIHKVSASDRGSYSCETLHDCTQGQLTVERECAHVVAMPPRLFIYLCCRPHRVLRALRPHMSWKQSLSESNLSEGVGGWGGGGAGIATDS